MKNLAALPTITFFNKRIEYIKFQNLYKKRKAVYNKIIAESSYSDELRPSIVFSYWRNLMTKPDCTEFYLSSDEKTINVNSFVLPDKVLKSKMKYSTAPGPDNLSGKDLNKITIRQKTKIFTLLLKMIWVSEVILS